MTILRENWLEENVAELLGLLDQLGIERTHLCGVCVGGTIALLFAAQNPERAGRIAVAGTCCYNEESITSAVLKFYPPPEDLPPDWVEELTSCHGENYARELYGIFYRAIREENGYPFKGYDLRQTLSSVKSPVIVIHGDGDGLFGVEQALAMHKHLRGSELYVVPDCGHLPNEEKPEDFNREVLRFLLRL
jgi:pimeloyl-ACP methyl ester carboxylesterase